VVSTPPGPGPSLASRQVGGAAHGQEIFVLYCQQCHGERGVKGVENPGSADGEVPSINPIDPAILGKTPTEFVDGLDDFLQNGSTPDATTSTPNASPRLMMPSFGNTYALTQPQIADAEAYVMQLNGVDRAAIVRPGLVVPKTYFWISLAALAVAVLICGVAIVRAGRSG
jgi:mono/diheme cytochrome c family protein